MHCLFPDYPKTVFRFRSYTPLSIKELLYGELFFASNDEINDPYDTKNPHIFNADIETYKRLISIMITPAGQKRSWTEFVDVEAIAQFLADKELLHSELISILKSQGFRAVTIKAFGFQYADLALDFIDRLRIQVIAAGGLCYIASFSKKCDNPVMWSHYSNHHKGFCLCFSIEDVKLKPADPKAPTRFFSSGWLEEVVYRESNLTVNGFYMFPASVLGGDDLTDVERKNYWDTRRQAYLTKYTSWSYEEEVRIALDDWFDCRSSTDGVIKKQIVERVYYYDQKQLTGIIFGAKMSSAEKTELKNIIYTLRRKLLLKHGEYLPLFIFYQSMENSRTFHMNIEPVEGIDGNNDGFAIEEWEAKKKEYDLMIEHFKKQTANR